MRLMYYLKHNLYVDRNTNILVYIKNINVNAVKVVQIVPFYSDKPIQNSMKIIINCDILD